MAYAVQFQGTLYWFKDTVAKVANPSRQEDYDFRITPDIVHAKRFDSHLDALFVAGCLNFMADSKQATVRKL